MNDFTDFEQYQIYHAAYCIKINCLQCFPAGRREVRNLKDQQLIEEEGFGWYQADHGLGWHWTDKGFAHIRAIAAMFSLSELRELENKTGIPGL